MSVVKPEGLRERARGRDALPDDLDVLRLRHTDVGRLLKAGGRSRGHARVLCTGNHTLDRFAEFLEAIGLCRELAVETRVAPFDQHMQLVLDPDSGLEKADADVLFLSLSLARMIPAHGNVASLTGSQQRELQEDILQQLRTWVNLAKERTTATLLIANFWPPFRLPLGIADARAETSANRFVASLNGQLLAEYQNDSQTYVVDVDQAIAAAGRHKARDPRMDFLAKMEWSDGVLPYVADLVSRYLVAHFLPPKKCLVLDLDNTLWGGVVGEDGPDQIKVGIGNPVAEAYYAFQQAVLAIKSRGFLLALCSKNNLSDVQEVFEGRAADMPLSLSDFVATRINWEPKHGNLLAIADELNIGADSLVFVDDSPAECELIRQALPDIRVLNLRGDPSGFASRLLELPELERASLTEEDLRKTEQYQENALRERSRSAAVDLTSYLESLQTRVVIRPLARADLHRAHQLLTKTNQFNLTTIRYRPADLERFLSSPSWDMAVVSATDRFGALGVIGLYILERCDGALRIDSLVLSCRALGRGIETAIANVIKAEARSGFPDGVITGEFRPTKRNAPAADFYQQQGFALDSEHANGVRRYRLEVRHAEPRKCPGIDLTVNEVQE